jgi:hypothetical protein
VIQISYTDDTVLVADEECTYVHSSYIRMYVCMKSVRMYAGHPTEWNDI